MSPALLPLDCRGRLGGWPPRCRAAWDSPERHGPAGVKPGHDMVSISAAFSGSVRRWYGNQSPDGVPYPFLRL